MENFAKVESGKWVPFRRHRFLTSSSCLFFFMVATVLRTEEEKVTVIRPEATELYKIEKKHLIRYINIGKPLDKRYGTTEIVQLNDSYSGPEAIQDWVDRERLTLAEAEQSKMWVSLKVDQDTKMGLVTDIKNELREASALKVLYSTGRRKALDEQ